MQQGQYTHINQPAALFQSFEDSGSNPTSPLKRAYHLTKADTLMEQLMSQEFLQNDYQELKLNTIGRYSGNDHEETPQNTQKVVQDPHYLRVENLGKKHQKKHKKNGFDFSLGERSSKNTVSVKSRRNKAKNGENSEDTPSSRFREPSFGSRVSTRRSERGRKTPNPKVIIKPGIIIGGEKTSSFGLEALAGDNQGIQGPGGTPRALKSGLGARGGYRGFGRSGSLEVGKTSLLMEGEGKDLLCKTNKLPEVDFFTQNHQNKVESFMDYFVDQEAEIELRPVGKSFKGSREDENDSEIYPSIIENALNPKKDLNSPSSKNSDEGFSRPQNDTSKPKNDLKAPNGGSAASESIGSEEERDFGGVDKEEGGRKTIQSIQVEGSALDYFGVEGANSFGTPTLKSTQVNQMAGFGKKEQSGLLESPQNTPPKVESGENRFLMESLGDSEYQTLPSGSASIFEGSMKPKPKKSKFQNPDSQQQKSPQNQHIGHLDINAYPQISISLASKAQQPPEGYYFNPINNQSQGAKSHQINRNGLQNRAPYQLETGNNPLHLPLTDSNPFFTNQKYLVKAKSYASPTSVEDRKLDQGGFGGVGKSSGISSVPLNSIGMTIMEGDLRGLLKYTRTNTVVMETPGGAGVEVAAPNFGVGPSIFEGEFGQADGVLGGNMGDKEVRREGKGPYDTSLVAMRSPGHPKTIKNVENQKMVKITQNRDQNRSRPPKQTPNLPGNGLYKGQPRLAPLVFGKAKNFKKSRSEQKNYQKITKKGKNNGIGFFELDEKIKNQIGLIDSSMMISSPLSQQKRFHDTRSLHRKARNLSPKTLRYYVKHPTMEESFEGSTDSKKASKALRFAFDLHQTSKKAEIRILRKVMKVIKNWPYLRSVNPDSRALKLLEYSFNQRLRPKRPDSSILRKSFLRWKAISSRSLQEHCIQKLAICSRMHHCIVIWRLKWLIEEPKKAVLSKRRFFEKRVPEFVIACERIRAQVYCARNQKLAFLGRLKDFYYRLKKFERGLFCVRRALRGRRSVGNSFRRVNRYAERRVWLLKRFIEKVENLKGFGFSRLKNHSLGALGRDLDTKEELVMRISTQILRDKVKEALSGIVSKNVRFKARSDLFRIYSKSRDRDTIDNTYRNDALLVRFEQGLRFLASLSKRKNQKYGFLVIRRLESKVELQRIKRLQKLKLVAIIAKTSQRIALQKLRNHSETKKSQIVQNLLDRLKGSYNNKSKQFINIARQLIPHSSQYKHFSMFINRLIQKNQEIQRKRAFGVLKEANHSLPKRRALSLQKLFLGSEARILRLKAVGFSEIGRRAAKERSKRFRYRNLSFIVKNRVERRVKFFGFFELKSRFKETLRREAAADKLFVKLCQASKAKEKQALAKMVMNMILIPETQNMDKMISEMKLEPQKPAGNSQNTNDLIGSGIGLKNSILANLILSGEEEEKDGSEAKDEVKETPFEQINRSHTREARRMYRRAKTSVYFRSTSFNNSPLKIAPIELKRPIQTPTNPVIQNNQTNNPIHTQTVAQIHQTEKKKQSRIFSFKGQKKEKTEQNQTNLLQNDQKRLVGREEVDKGIGSRRNSTYHSRIINHLNHISNTEQTQLTKLIAISKNLKEYEQQTEFKDHNTILAFTLRRIVQKRMNLGLKRIEIHARYLVWKSYELSNQRWKEISLENQAKRKIRKIGKIAFGAELVNRWYKRSSIGLTRVAFRRMELNAGANLTGERVLIGLIKMSRFEQISHRLAKRSSFFMMRVKYGAKNQARSKSSYVFRARRKLVRTAVAASINKNNQGIEVDDGFKRGDGGAGGRAVVPLVRIGDSLGYGVHSATSAKYWNSGSSGAKEEPPVESKTLFRRVNQKFLTEKRVRRIRQFRRSGAVKTIQEAQNKTQEVKKDGVGQTLKPNGEGFGLRWSFGEINQITKIEQKKGKNQATKAKKESGGGGSSGWFFWRRKK